MLKIEKPFHGAVLNRKHGEESDGGLKIIVCGTAHLLDHVTINGMTAQRSGTRFFSDVIIREKETEIVAVSNGIHGSQEHRIKVLWDKYSQPRYRFSIDDNSFFPKGYCSEELQFSF